MQKLVIDTGVQAFEVNGGVLRFNPGDPNIYHRFFAAQSDLQRLDEELQAKMAALTPNSENQNAENQTGTNQTAIAAAALALLAEYDGKIKALLTGIFGPENSFDALLQGVNLAAVGANGQRVVQNLFAALTPVLQAGAQRTVQGVADAALAEAEAEKAARNAPVQAPAQV